jgi:hypothetical protein
LFFPCGAPGCSLSGLPFFQDFDQSAQRDLAIGKL